MSRLLKEDTDAGAAVFPERAWYVAGEPQTQTAARFWHRILWELETDFDPGASLRLHAVGGARLDRGLLHPHEALERALAEAADREIGAAMRELCAELDILGPPGSVSACVLYDDIVVLETVLPSDVVDTEILPYLLSWILEWGHIPPTHWNDARVAGTFAAGPAPTASRRIDFVLERRHLSEGLFEWVLTIEQKG